MAMSDKKSTTDVEHQAVLSQSDERFRQALIEDITARKQTEELIQRQAALLELTYDAVILWKFQSEIVYWNKGAERLYGFTRDEAVGRITHDLLQTRHDVSPQSIYDALLQSGKWEGERIHRTKDGRQIIVECRKVLVTEQDGSLFIMEANRDITERKERQERQQLLNEASEQLVSALSHQITLQEIARMIVPFLADYCRIVLLDERQTPRQITAYHVNPEKVALVSALFEVYKDLSSPTHGIHRILQTGRPELMTTVTDSDLATVSNHPEVQRLVHELELQSYMGVPLLARDKVIGAITFSSIQPWRHYSHDDLLFAQELARRIALTLENARLYQEAQTELAERKQIETNLLFLSEASKILASSLDYQTTLTHVAHLAVSHIADWCAIEMLAENGQLQSVAVAHKDPTKVKWAQELREATPPDISESSGIGLAMKTQKSGLYPHITDDMIVAAARNKQELENLRKLGMKSIMIIPLITQEKVLGTISFVSAESGKQYSPADLAMAEELSSRAALAIENARLYTEAQRAIGIRDDFISIASHELRTPVTSLKMYTQVLQKQLAKKGEEGLSRSLAKMDAQLNKLTALISDLLNVSKIELGRLAFQEYRFDVNEIVKETMEAIQATTTKHTICLEGRIPYPVWGDKDRIGQVLTNLLSNAVKYSPQGGRVIVRLSSEPDAAVVSVQDFGIGIEKEHQSKIFTRFYRVSDPEEKTFPGLGIGLYIAHDIIQRHGGQLTVESEKGKGSLFRLTLPYQSRTRKTS